MTSDRPFEYACPPENLDTECGRTETGAHIGRVERVDASIVRSLDVRNALLLAQDPVPVFRRAICCTS
jgi:hypothetical protein